MSVRTGRGETKGCTDAENGTAGPGLETLCLGPRFCLRETPAVGSTVSRYREHSAANTAKTRVSRQHTVCVVQETHLWESSLSLSLSGSVRGCILQAECVALPQLPCKAAPG